ncbi:MAG: serine/threonine protein kinase, partial [Myxococcales bacterium]|nr:serine/threonine protein kinase [Myxococcales bacterium]
LVGTPYYCSPEQATSDKEIDYRSDLWSFAVIIYRCLTGELPFTGNKLGALLLNIMHAPLPVPS